MDQEQFVFPASINATAARVLPIVVIVSMDIVLILIILARLLVLVIIFPNPVFVLFALHHAKLVKQH